MNATEGGLKGSKVRLNPMGVPGQLQHIIFVNQFADPLDPRNNSGPSGKPGQSKVVFVFNRPGYSLLPENRSVFANELKGGFTSRDSAPRVCLNPKRRGNSN